jgi:hypothetical protein
MLRFLRPVTVAERKNGTIGKLTDRDGDTLAVSNASHEQLIA